MLKRPGFTERTGGTPPSAAAAPDTKPWPAVQTEAPVPHADEGCPTLPWRIEGGLVPVLHLDIGAGHPSASFEPRDVLWKDDEVVVGLKGDGGIMGTLGGMLKRGVAGVNVLLASASGHGTLALSRGEPGCISAVTMMRGERVMVREGAFLAATAGISCGFERVQGAGNVLLGGSGLFIGTFQAEEDGILFVHGLGDLSVMELTPYKSVEVAQHAWVWKDGAMDMMTVTTNMGNAIMGTGSILMHRFTGPGRLGIQSGRKPHHKPE